MSFLELANYKWKNLTYVLLNIFQTGFRMAFQYLFIYVLIRSTDIEFGVLSLGTDDGIGYNEWS